MSSEKNSGIITFCSLFSRAGFDSDLVVDGLSQSLFAAEIFFSGLHGDVAQQKPNLFQLAPALWQRRAHSVRASAAVNQFPSREPSFFAPFTRRMPAARSGLNNPESAASYASRRTAASLTFMVPAAR